MADWSTNSSVTFSFSIKLNKLHILLSWFFHLAMMMSICDQALWRSWFGSCQQHQNSQWYCSPKVQTHGFSNTSVELQGDLTIHCKGTNQKFWEFELTCISINKSIVEKLICFGKELKLINSVETEIFQAYTSDQKLLYLLILMPIAYRWKNQLTNFVELLIWLLPTTPKQSPVLLTVGLIH